MFTLRLFFLTSLFVITCGALQPKLSEKSVHEKVQAILDAHVEVTQLSEEILARALCNYVEELDPHKLYFLQNELDAYLNPSKESLKQILREYKSLNFRIFEKIYSLFQTAIQRRNAIETKLGKHKPEKTIDNKELKDLKWVENKEKLVERLEIVRAMQLENAEKIPDLTKEEVLKHIDKRRKNREKDFFDTKQKSSHIYSLILKSIASAFDTHTNYFTPNEANQFMIQVQQRLFGIGAQLRDTFNGFTILRIIDGGPAAKCEKLKINDRIIAVNHEPIIGMDIAEGVEKIRGEQGTEVLLTILREHANENLEQFDIKLVRDEIVIEETRIKSSYSPYGDGVLVYLKLYSFYQDENTSSTKDIKKALATIEKDYKIQGVLLDLRGNGGGLIQEAVGVTGLFIQQGIVTSVKNSSGKVEHLREMDGNCVYAGPLVVLTDKASASASEIVAQALQDYQRAVIVGDTETVGKGSVQEFTLGATSPGKVNPEGEFKVTTRKYYTVSGKSPQLVGVKADIVVPSLFAHMEIGEKFAKYPLKNDAIEANFEDKFEDFPVIHRYQANKMFRHSPQKITDIFFKHLPRIKQNSEMRLQENKDYQVFLEELAQENYDGEAVDYFRKADLQKQEAENILKDLVYLYEKRAAS